MSPTRPTTRPWVIRRPSAARVTVRSSTESGRGVGQVLGRRPDGGTARGLLQGDERGAQPAPAEQEVARRAQLGDHGEPPVQIVVHRLHAEELLGLGHRPCVPSGPAATARWRPRRRGPSVPRDLRPRHLLVDPDVTGQPEDPLTEDVALDLRGAALDRVGPRPDEHLPGRTRPARPGRGSRPAASCSRTRPWRRLPSGRCRARRPAC